MGVDVHVIRPQPGPQEIFLGSSADIALYGGAAGAGKSFALLLCPLRHVNIPAFGGVIFRRTSPQITNEGALWDEAVELYTPAGATPIAGDKYFRFPSGATMSFGHLQHEQTKLDWQGSQIPYIGFDELTHFTKSQFFYMFSRNRSNCGVRPYIRATTNPDCDSWVADFISWWIDPATGVPIPERSGVIRYFVRVGEDIIWGDSAFELEDAHPGTQAKSFTFIAAKLSDNQILMKNDPGYLSNLLALPPVERERLLGGNWKIRSGTAFFNLNDMLVDGLPVPLPEKCDAVFAVMDTAMKDGTTNDCTAVSYFAINRIYGHPLVLLDWDAVQIKGAFLAEWLPSVMQRLEYFAETTRARNGSAGCWIEDANSGSILLQIAEKRPDWNVHAIDSALVSAGKSNRAVAVSEYVFHGKLKISQPAFDKVVSIKGHSANHWIKQITSFSVGATDGQADDLADTAMYGLAIALGNSEGV